MKFVVVADAGPLHYLILIDAADVLVSLFDRVLIPTAVRDELIQINTPRKVRSWMATPRVWLQIESVSQPQRMPGLHRGEAEALQLAVQINGASVLMDDRDGRAEARRLGLTTIGTVGVLERAAEKELIQLPAALAKLQTTNFFVSDELLAAALARDCARKKT
ncbi:MAG: DUF3368 domain-containing protein [Verrucomicrobia bacterium]|nr:DUF3368 domain-containing protein [Verrucomicrobiota bacterium]